MSRLLKKRVHNDTTEAKAHAAEERRIRRRLLLILAGCLLLVIGSYALINAYQHRAKPKTGFQTALGIKPAAATEDTIRSTLQFSVHYNKQIFEPVGYVVREDQTFDVFTEKDVLKPASYGVIVLYSKKVPKAEHALGRLSELKIVSNIHEDFFARRAAEPAYGKGLSQLDTTEKFFKPKDLTTGKYTEGKRSTVTIEGIEYRKVLYTYTDNKYLSSNHTYEYYYTVQNNRPYVVSISRTDDPDQEFVGALRSLIGNVKYGEASQSATYGSANSEAEGKVDSTQDTGANLPDGLVGETALKVAAKNQPAVVRVGTNYCAGVTLLLPNKKEFMKVPVSCAPAIGSGSIVSADGYISTNGHVTRMTPDMALMSGLISSLEDGNAEPLKNYLAYLIATGVMSKTQLEALLSAAKAGDAEANNKIMYSAENIPKSNMVVTGEYTQYAIQLGHDPLKITRKGTKYTFNYGKTIVKAKHVDSDFDPYSAKGGVSDLTQSKSSDVSILKMDGSNYPVLKLGSIDQLKKGDLITAIGFPAFVDDGLDTKLKYTVPTVTQGRVSMIEYDSPQKVRKLVGSTTPIAPGNSGGPAVTESSAMAGLNTYGTPDCGDHQCFASQSYFRDVADYKALIAKNNISLKDSSSITADWSSAIDLFSEGKYSEANDQFTKVRESYPAFYLADSFINQANAQIDAKTKSRNLIIGIGLVLLLSVACIVFAFRTYRNLRRHRRSGIRNGYYAQPQPPSQPAVSNGLPPQTYFTPTIPVNPSNQPQPTYVSPVPPQAPQVVQSQPPIQPSPSPLPAGPSPVQQQPANPLPQTQSQPPTPPAQPMQ